MAADFIIRERLDLGGYNEGGAAAEFRFTVDGKSIPSNVWDISLNQRTARTDYPGNAAEPTEQVFGANYADFTLTGRWSDKYNPTSGSRYVPSNGQTLIEYANTNAGYALNTMYDFKEMVRRGNMVEIIFGDLTFTGIIKNVTFSVRRFDDIGYSFTFSPHKGMSDRPLRRVADQTKPPIQLVSEIQARLEEIQAQSENQAAQVKLSGSDYNDTQALLDEIESSVRSFANIVDQRVLAVDAAIDSSLSYKRTLAAADTIINRSLGLARVTAARRSDLNLAYQDAIGVLNFETWNRGLASVSRRTIFDTWDARQQIDRQNDRDAIALYRPFAGESLYSVSNRFYNTPFRWREIKERNRLESATLDGTELLVIPRLKQ